jgi:hypothetical protein
MIPTVIRSALIVPAAVAALTGVALATPAVSNAAECGPGTVYDAASNLCVAAPAPAAQWNAPPPPPALPPPPAPLPPLPPISICPPIPFVPVCFPLN